MQSLQTRNEYAVTGSVDIEMAKLLARCRRIGWEVEEVSGDDGDALRIRVNDGRTITINANKWNADRFAAASKQLEELGFYDIERDAEEAERQRTKEAKEQRHKQALALAAGPMGVHQPDISWLTTPSDFPQARFMLIDPPTAKHLLDTINTDNRQLQPENTKFFVDLIEHGQLGTTHQGIAIDTRGVLQDGQHRFAAMQVTQTSHVFLVVIGLPPDNFAKVDGGKNRSAVDVARKRGEVNPAAISAATRLLMELERYGPELHVRGKKGRISVYSVDAHMQRLGEPLREAVRQGARIRKEVSINPAALTAAIYLITQRLPEGDPRVAKFFRDLETGLGLDDKQDPVWMLRRKFIRARDLGARYGRIGQHEALAYIIRAWNLRASGRKIGHLAWRHHEPFPCNVFLPPPLDSDPHYQPEKGGEAP